MRATRGSQRWLQLAVNERRDVLDSAIRAATGFPPDRSIEWLSPLAHENYGEYRDGAFLRRLGVEPKHQPLSEFWPNGGPVWDALARTNAKDLLLVEAKAHIPELLSPGTKASPESKKRIQKALEDTRKVLAPGTKKPWDDTFYQLTNRLAHLYFLRSVNRERAHLVFLYFVGATDVKGPSTVDEWKGAIRVAEGFLGVERHKLSKFVHHAFVDVRDLS
jgi:hypothetical protein